MTIRLLSEQFADRPAFDTAVSHALLRKAASGEAAQSLRLHQPGSLVAFGRQDVVSPGYLPAVAAARTAGYEAVERLAGGRAAVFHEGTIAFGWTIPTPKPRETIKPRFEALDSVLLAAFRTLGVDARVGEVPGEYCPGAYSVHTGGRKVMGVGQRLTRRAAHIGGVIVVDRPDLVNLPLGPVYRHLGYGWDPAATGALTGAASVGVEQAAAAVISALGSRATIVERPVDEDTLDAARGLASGHLPG